MLPTGQILTRPPAAGRTLPGKGSGRLPPQVLTVLLTFGNRRLGTRSWRAHCAHRPLLLCTLKLWRLEKAPPGAARAPQMPFRYRPHRRAHTPPPSSLHSRPLFPLPRVTPGPGTDGTDGPWVPELARIVPVGHPEPATPRGLAFPVSQGSALTPPPPTSASRGRCPLGPCTAGRPRPPLLGNGTDPSFKVTSRGHSHWRSRGMGGKGRGRPHCPGLAPRLWAGPREEASGLA